MLFLLFFTAFAAINQDLLNATLIDSVANRIMEFVPPRKHMLVHSYDNKISVQTKPGHQPTQVYQHTETLRVFALSSNSRYLASTSSINIADADAYTDYPDSSCRIFLWDLNTDTRKVLQGDDKVEDLSFSNNSKILVTKSKKGYLSFWDVESGDLQGKSKSPWNKVRMFSKDDSRLLASNGPELVCYDMKGKVLFSIKHKFYVDFAAYVDDTILVRTGDHRLWKYDVLGNLLRQESDVEKILLAPGSEDTMLVVKKDLSAQIVSASRSSPLLFRVDEPYMDFQFSRDGKLLVGQRRWKWNYFHMWNIETGERQTIEGRDVTFSKEKNYIAITRGESICILNVQSGEIVRMIPKRSFGGSQFSEDGNILFVQEGITVKIWDVKYGTLLGQVKHETNIPPPIIREV